ncbi:MAG: hypothetical protein A2418_03085 [Candidatus Brennerbacteria bacterium RIFOXYC1_FULL_41_11]|uniref:Uncharacterized protein n=1 Tax=Candidatus Brennerbacteria bacterium RIFOXYD1_FULL_41_16 TaxID=1797529 RepID=A0A1G1XL06_9BACT|nr:MAG: hypothetical protein UU61_C0009G0006 [Parcubacteria group bacterium GW2011_GWB1_41_4]OGY39136.1 MAG: hypothetical protein A2391_00690 [Candidatus Brennerbacteria bacterium RIFOXYB1_FULL_41_13]OGY39817.1 MAG: hypothetical protein A2418_03085 [Candidatus Brennerbacteria bacterium RIFOXYC1_FULL_41_11]OGY40584.1 MAG: hypothetical protein A2570_02515 [Candidatus Brennerbacteria bacterium RIFOXYD1_FULL_41_16]
MSRDLLLGLAIVLILGCLMIVGPLVLHPELRIPIGMYGENLQLWREAHPRYQGDTAPLFEKIERIMPSIIIIIIIIAALIFLIPVIKDIVNILG